MNRYTLTEETRALMREAWGDDLDVAIQMHEYTARTFDRDVNELALAVLARGQQSINQFRAECQCLPPLQRWTEAESCTDMQSAADQSGGGPHGNFGSCGESAQNTCPDWGSEEQIISGCLQAMWDEGPGEPFIEHGHYINMSSTQYTKVACGFYETPEGDFWAIQNFQ